MQGMSTETRTASEFITDEVTAWPGVEAGIGRRGEYGFTVGRKQIGHLHGDRIAHFGFPKAVWQELYDAGRITYHPVFPDKKGWAARAIESDDDVADVVVALDLTRGPALLVREDRVVGDAAGVVELLPHGLGEAEVGGVVAVQVPQLLAPDGEAVLAAAAPAGLGAGPRGDLVGDDRARGTRLSRAHAPHHRARTVPATRGNWS